MHNCGDRNTDAHTDPPADRELFIRSGSGAISPPTHPLTVCRRRTGGRSAGGRLRGTLCSTQTDALLQTDSDDGKINQQDSWSWGHGYSGMFLLVIQITCSMLRITRTSFSNDEEIIIK